MIFFKIVFFYKCDNYYVVMTQCEGKKNPDLNDFNFSSLKRL